MAILLPVASAPAVWCYCEETSWCRWYRWRAFVVFIPIPIPIPFRARQVGAHGAVAKAPGGEDSEAWSALRNRVLSYLGPEANDIHLVLAPLELGPHLVGALLCVVPTEPPTAVVVVPSPLVPRSVSVSEGFAEAAPEGPLTEPHAQAHISTVGGGGGLPSAVARGCGGGGGRAPRRHHRSGGGGSGGGACDGELLRLHWSPRAVRAVLGVLVDCLFAPHLRNILQVGAARGGEAGGRGCSRDGSYRSLWVG